MKHFKLLNLTLLTTILTLKLFGQANPFVNVLPGNSGIVAVGCPIDIFVDIGNTGPISTIPQAKLRPIIEVPPSVTYLPTAQQTGLPAGWTILTNSGSQIRVCNSTDPLPINTIRTIVLKAVGVTVSPPQTFSANINFGNGTTCAPGPAVAGDLTTDNSATSTIEVIAAPSLSTNGTLSQFSTSIGIPSSQQSFTLTGSNITEDLLVNAPSGFEVSITSGTGFAPTATITPTGGVLSNYPVYVRMAAPTTTGSIAGNIVISSVSTTCVAPQNIPVSGVISGAPLPVLINDFSVKTDNCEAYLTWSTSNEFNTEKFEIEKSEVDNPMWRTIGSVKSRGNTNTQSTYHFKDDYVSANSNKVMYRLKIIDLDGSFIYSPVIYALAECEKQSINVYPNPLTNGKLTISLISPRKVEANLLSMTGQIIKTFTLNNGMNDIDVSELSSGVYVLSVKFLNGVNRNVKVKVQN